MEKREKLRKYYKSIGVNVNDETISMILKDTERTEQLIRKYEMKEIEAMNYILGKEPNNMVFEKTELEAMNKIDLFNQKLVRACKTIWDYRDNEDALNYFLQQLKAGVSND